MNPQTIQKLVKNQRSKFQFFSEDEEWHTPNNPIGSEESAIKGKTCKVWRLLWCNWDSKNRKIQTNDKASQQSSASFQNLVGKRINHDSSYQVCRPTSRHMYRATTWGGPQATQNDGQWLVTLQVSRERKSSNLNIYQVDESHFTTESMSETHVSRYYDSYTISIDLFGDHSHSWTILGFLRSYPKQRKYERNKGRKFSKVHNL